MYRGKTRDGFAYAVTSLFYVNGIEYIPSPECLSQRSVAISWGVNEKECFTPVLKWEDYLPIMLNNLGVKRGYVLDRLGAKQLQSIPDGTFFVIGETLLDKSDAAITNKLIKTPAFLICRKTSDSFIVSDPIGCICFEANGEELLSPLNETEPFLLYLRDLVSVMPRTHKEILAEAVKIENEFNRIDPLCDTSVTLNNSKKKGIFQSRLLGYLSCRRETAEFCDMSDEIFFALSDITVCKNFCDMEKIYQAETVFKKELESAWRRSHNVG